MALVFSVLLPQFCFLEKQTKWNGAQIVGRSRHLSATVSQVRQWKITRQANHQQAQTAWKLSAYFQVKIVVDILGGELLLWKVSRGG